MSLVKSIAGNEICDQTARNSIDSLRKTANPYNLITISPYNLKPDSNYNQFTTLNTTGDDVSSLCVQGRVSDHLLMFGVMEKYRVVIFSFMMPMLNHQGI